MALGLESTKCGHIELECRTCQSCHCSGWIPPRNPPVISVQNQHSLPPPSPSPLAGPCAYQKNPISILLKTHPAQRKSKQAFSARFARIDSRSDWLECGSEVMWPLVAMPLGLKPPAERDNSMSSNIL